MSAQIEKIDSDTKSIELSLIEDNMIVHRDEHGVSITIKSPMLENFFSKYPKMDGVLMFNGLTPYKLPDGMDSYTRRTLQYVDYNQLFVDGYVNISFIRAVGIGKGITVKINSVCSKTELRRYCREMANMIQVFANEYLKPVQVRVNITSE